MTRIALVYGPDAVPAGEESFVGSWTSLAARLNLGLVRYPVRSSTEIVQSIQSVAQDPMLGLMASADAFIGTNRALAMAEAARRHLPAVWGNLNYAAEGGLIAYAIDPIPMSRGAGEYVGVVLNGGNPATMPIQVSPPLLAVNLKTAKALGISIPVSILAAAEQVIE
jgi:putative ABC transport system substrate-binding protein